MTDYPEEFRGSKEPTHRQLFRHRIMKRFRHLLGHFRRRTHGTGQGGHPTFCCQTIWPRGRIDGRQVECHLRSGIVKQNSRPSHGGSELARPPRYALMKRAPKMRDSDSGMSHAYPVEEVPATPEYVLSVLDVAFRSWGARRLVFYKPIQLTLDMTVA